MAVSADIPLWPAPAGIIKSNDVWMLVGSGLEDDLALPESGIGSLLGLDALKAEAGDAIGDEFDFAVENGLAAVDIGLGDESLDAAELSIGKGVGVGNADVLLGRIGAVGILGEVELQIILVLGRQDVDRALGWGGVLIDKGLDRQAGSVAEGDGDVVVGELTVDVVGQDGHSVGYGIVGTSRGNAKRNGGELIGGGESAWRCVRIWCAIGKVGCGLGWILSKRCVGRGLSGAG